MVPHIAFYRGRVGDVNLVREALNVQEGEDAGYTERQSKRNEAQREVRYVISMDSKMAPIPMLMFSAVMYLVCGSGSGEESDAEKPRLTSLTRPIIAKTESAVACQNVRNTETTC